MGYEISFAEKKISLKRNNIYALRTSHSPYSFGKNFTDPFTWSFWILCSTHL